MRGGGFLTVLGSVTALVASPFYPPTAAFGPIGWLAIVPPLMASAVVGGRHLAFRAHPSMRWLHLSSFIGIAQAGLLEWLAGGGKAPFVQLLMIPMLGAGSGQPVRRCAWIVSFASLVALSPALYSSIALASTVLEFGLLSTLTLMVSVVLASTRADRENLKAAREQATELAHVDQLTGIANRRAFDRALADAIVRAEELDEQFAVILCDVDSFKEINDLFGHAAGDEVLTTIAAAVAGALRRPGEAFRWAGDEFAVILGDCNESGAQRVAERLRKAVAAQGRRPDGHPVEISTGVAASAPAIGAEALLDRADRALLACKALRRRVTTAA